MARGMHCIRSVRYCCNAWAYAKTPFVLGTPAEASRDTFTSKTHASCVLQQGWGYNVQNRHAYATTYSSTKCNCHRLECECR